MTVDVAKLAGYAVVGEVGSKLELSKLVGFAVVETGAPPNALGGSTSLSFSIEDALIVPEGIASLVEFGFAVSSLATGDGGLTGVGAVAGSASLSFLLQGSFLNPSSFEPEIGLSRGGCPQLRVAHHACEERSASWPEARPDRIAGYRCSERTASYYKEE